MAHAGHVKQNKKTLLILCLQTSIVLRLVCVFWTAAPETVVHVEIELSFENISKRATFNLVPATVRRVET